MKAIILILSATVILFSCTKQNLTKKDLMNAYTIGWHRGYSQGKWINTAESESFWYKSRWIQDSCLFDNSIWAIE